MPQIDLNATSTPRSPYIDNSNALNRYHLPNGQGATAVASDNPGVSAKAAANSQNTAVKVTVSGCRFANPA